MPAQLDLGGSLALGRDAQLPAQLGVLQRKPMLRHKQFPIPPGPEALRLVGHGQERADLAQFHLAQPPIVLAPCASRLRTCLTVGACVQDEDTACAQQRSRGHLGTDLCQHGRR